MSSEGWAGFACENSSGRCSSHGRWVLQTLGAGRSCCVCCVLWRRCLACRALVELNGPYVRLSLQGTSKVPLGGFATLQGVHGPQRFSIHKAFGPPVRLPTGALRCAALWGLGGAAGIQAAWQVLPRGASLAVCMQCGPTAREGC